ncbi:MAG: geranylgeranyl reductase family protein [Bacteroidia bacterium]|nr:geranylgeranyl reductase family protein [Bacteroidia bacterium]
MSERNEKLFDVIICGGGPAGSTCALALADSGLKVAVIEKQKFPRDKVCGDAIAAYVHKVLNTINPKFKDALSEFKEKVMVDTCRIVAPNANAFDITFSQSGFISTRVSWDNFLYELASVQNNITYFLNHAVTEVIIDSTKCETIVQTEHTSFKGKIVIGCDGAHSIINKKIVGTKPDLNHYSGAVRAYYKNVTGIPDRTFELHFIKGLSPGYFWIFPLKDNLANVGLGALSASISKQKLNLRKIFEDAIHNVSYLKERFKDAEQIGQLEGFGLPLGSRKVVMSGDNFMLCGDAASLIDPLSGEGIGQAMVSGRYAGWQAKKCFDQNNFTGTFMKQYDKLVYDKFWARHRKNYLIQQMIGKREWLLNGVVNLTSRNRFIKDLLMRALN